MKYTKVVGAVLSGTLNPDDLDAPAVNPKFDIDLQLRKNGYNSCELLAIVKNIRHKAATNLDVSCNGGVYDYSNMEPFWDRFEIYLGDVMCTPYKQYKLTNGLVFDNSYKLGDSLSITVTSCGDGNTFTADVAGLLSDASKGTVTIY